MWPFVNAPPLKDHMWQVCIHCNICLYFTIYQSVYCLSNVGEVIHETLISVLNAMWWFPVKHQKYEIRIETYLELSMDFPNIITFSNSVNSEQFYTADQFCSTSDTVQNIWLFSHENINTLINPRCNYISINKRWEVYMYIVNNYKVIYTVAYNNLCILTIY